MELGKAGVQLGGDTHSQINEGIPVSPGEVRAGDLIFTKSSFGEGGRPGPGHVQLGDLGCSEAFRVTTWG